MKNRIKVISLLFFFLVLVGCGTNDTESEVSKENTDSAENKITFVTWLTEEKEENQAVIDAYKEENPDVEVEFKYVGDNQTDNYYQQVDLMLMSDEPVDIVATAAYPEHAQRAAAGTYLALDEFFEEEGVKPEDIYEENFLAPVKGQIYGIPGDSKSWIIYINKDKLDEAGLPSPELDWTWDDYEEYAEALTTDDTYGSYFHTWDHYNYLNIWSLRLGNPMIYDDGQLAFDDPNFKAFLEYRKDMEEKGYMLPYKTIKATQSTYRDRFFNGEIAMLPLGTFLLPELDSIDAFPHDFETTFAMMPRDSEAPEGRTYAESLYYSVAKNSKNPELAYDFIRFYTTEGARIKGKHLPTEKGANKMDYVEPMIGDEKYVDMDALERVMTNPKWEDNPNTKAPSYQKALSDIMVEEAEKYYLDEVDVDTAIENMLKRGEDLQNRADEE